MRRKGLASFSFRSGYHSTGARRLSSEKKRSVPGRVWGGSKRCELSIFALFTGFDGCLDSLKFGESSFEIVAGHFLGQHLKESGVSGPLEMRK